MTLAKQFLRGVMLVGVLISVGTGGYAHAQTGSSPVADAPFAAAPFQFSDPTLDREWRSHQAHVQQEYARASVSITAARRALASARPASLGSAEWLHAREMVGAAVREEDTLRSVLRERTYFLERAMRSTAGQERVEVGYLEASSEREACDPTERTAELLRLLLKL
jgi:hypothetical protein